MTHPGVLLKAFGLRASKKRGQNFLVEPASARAIAASAGIGPGDTVVEIGAGLGALTLELARLARRVVAVEVDRGVFAVLEQVLAEQGVAEKVQPLLADALRLDWAALAREADGRLVVAGNLPYAISSPLIFNLLENRAHWKSASFMLQQEVVRRLVTPPGSKDYGRMSVLVQAFCEVSPGMRLGPEQFFPRPQVESQVVHLRPREKPLVELAGPEEEAWFSRVVKAAFSQRRKKLANSLAGGLNRPREEMTRALQAAGLDPGRRAETLSPPELAAVARALSPS